MNIVVTKHAHRLDTKNYTLDDVLAEVNECVAMLTHLGYNMGNNSYSVAWNTRALRRLGQCCYRGNINGKREFLLNFNKRYFETAEPRSIHNTIMHEVCHSVSGCMNHKTGGWKDVVNMVNYKFGYSISRTTSDPYYKSEVLDKLAESGNKYEVFCSQCNKVVCVYERRSKTINGIMQNPNRWKCGGCGKWGTLSIR